MKRRIFIGVGVVLVLLVGVVVFARDSIMSWVFRPTQSVLQNGTRDEWSAVEVVAQDLATPWSLARLSGGDLLVTERSGTLVRVGKSGQTFPITGVQETSEGGLLGVALHPQFADNSRVYVYFTTTRDGALQNQVDQYRLDGDTLTDRRTILEAIPAARNHNGGAIAFGPDDRLYVTTGDAAQRDLAQDTTSLAGKILRINDDGTVPNDNPFSNLIWSYGHRNPQGIAWDQDGTLWAVEHGPSGEWKGRGKDELNRIEKGANYGWPVIAGDETNEGMRTPVAHSGENETWAPAGMAYSNGSLFFAGLRGASLYEAKLTNDGVTISRHFAGEYGRLRAVLANGNDLYFTTSNNDGRGRPSEDDDKVLRMTRRD